MSPLNYRRVSLRVISCLDVFVLLRRPVLNMVTFRDLRGTLRVLGAMIMLQWFTGQGLKSCLKSFTTVGRGVRLVMMCFWTFFGQNIELFIEFSCSVLSWQCLTRSVIRQAVAGRLLMKA